MRIEDYFDPSVTMAIAIYCVPVVVLAATVAAIAMQWMKTTVILLAISVFTIFSFDPNWSKKVVAPNRAEEASDVAQMASRAVAEYLKWDPNAFASQLSVLVILLDGTEVSLKCCGALSGKI